MLEYDNALSFSKKIRSHPTYRHSKAYQLSGGQTVNLSSGSTTESVFELPTSSHVVNHSKSFLKFTLNVPSAGNTSYNRLLMNGVSVVDRIMIQTKSGIQLCDITNVPNYTSMVLPYHTSLNEFVTKDSPNPKLTDTCLSDSNLFNPSRVTKDSVRSIDQAGVQAALSVDYSDIPSYYESAAENGGGVNSLVYMNILLPLSTIGPDSILSMDRNMYYGETLLLYVYWSSTARIGFLGTASPAIATGLAPLAGQVSLTRLALYNAIESNVEIQNGLQDKARTSEGISMVIPYVYGFKTTTAQASNSSIQTRLSRAHGVNLLRVWTSIFNASSNYQFSMNNSNSDNSILVDVYDELNSQRLCDFNWSSANNELYLALRDKLVGSVIQNSAMFRAHQVWLRDFTNLPCVDFIENNTAEDGVSLAQEQIYTSNMTKVNAVNQIFTYCVTQKILNIGASGITLL